MKLEPITHYLTSILRKHPLYIVNKGNTSTGQITHDESD
jgi:hypothetical protein